MSAVWRAMPRRGRRKYPWVIRFRRCVPPGEEPNPWVEWWRYRTKAMRDEALESLKRLDKRLGTPHDYEAIDEPWRAK